MCEISSLLTDSGSKCFPSLVRVKLQDGRLVKMSELQIGDQVQTGMKSVSMFELQIGDHVHIKYKQV